MKRILSVLLALVMVIGLFPMGILSAGAAGTDVSMDIYATTGTLASDSLSISWTSAPITFTVNKNASSTAIRTSDSDHFRMYQGTSVNIACSAGNITKIVMTATSSSYATVLQTSANDTTNGSTPATVSVSGSVVTITPTSPAATYSIGKMSAQSRINKVVVTYAEASGCAHANTVTQNAVAAGCATAGYTGDIYCTDCEEIAEYGSSITPTGHTFVDGVCSACSLNQDDVTSYEAVSVDTVAEGAYIICGTKGSENKYPATTTISGSDKTDWEVSSSALIVNNDIITADLLPADAQVFELTGDNTNGFSIGYDNGEEMVYLGYSSYANRKLEFSNAHSTTLWVVTAVEAGGVWLVNTNADGNAYNVGQAQGTTASTALRGYAGGTSIDGIYLFKKVPTTQDLCEHSFGDWTVTEAATCTENGKQVHTCSLCQLEESEYIEKLGHTVVDGVCSTCNETIYTLATTLADNDNVIIYYVAGELALTATASGSKLTGTAASVTDGHLIYTDAMAVMQVEYVDDTNFYLISADGKYLTSGATGSSLTFADAPSLYSNWYLAVADETDGLVYIKNTNAAYNSKAQDLEYYSGFTTYSTGTGSAYEMQLYVQAGTAACEHTWSDWTVETESTCTALGVNVRTCTTEGGCGHTQRSAIAMLGHNYTLGDTAVCANCSASLPLSTIATVKSYTANTVYYFEGIVTYVSGKNVYIEDSTGGVCVYFASAPSDIALGDQLRVCDTMTAYKGLIETTNTVAGEYYVVSSGNALPSQEVTIEALKADTTNEYLGERVVIKGATVSAISSGSYTLSDGSNTIVIYKASNISEKVVVGSTVDVTAVVSTYNGYQLLVNPGTAATDVKKIGNYAIWADGAEVDVYVTFAEAYAALAEGQYIKLLADVGAEDAIVELAMDKDLYVDLNWYSMYVNVTANGYTIYGMDNSTDTYDNTEEYGYLVAQGATVAPVTSLSGSNYLAIDVTDEIGLEGYTAWSFHAYAVKLTYVSLDPTNDALGYKAQLFADEMVLAKVTGFGFHMGVEGGQQKEYSKTGAPTNGVFTLRLKNIMAGNGGEMSIIADAFVNFEGVTDAAVSAEYSTTMKAAILAVNELTALSDAQKTAVYNLYAQYSEVMDAWFTAEGKTNNIIGWAPAATEE